MMKVKSLCKLIFSCF